MIVLVYTYHGKSISPSILKDNFAGHHGLVGCDHVLEHGINMCSPGVSLLPKGMMLFSK